MSKVVICTVFDSKAAAYLPLFSARSHGEAERMFGHEANKSDSNISLYPEDFTLFALGTFDDQVGAVGLYDKPVCLGCASSFKK